MHCLCLTNAPKQYSGHEWLEIKHHPTCLISNYPLTCSHILLPASQQPPHPQPTPPHRIDLCLGRRDQITRHSIVRLVSLLPIPNQPPLAGVAISKQRLLLFTDTFMYILGFWKDPRRRSRRQASSKPSQTTNTRHGLTMAINFNASPSLLYVDVVLSHRDA